MNSKDETPSKSTKLPVTEHTDIEIGDDDVLYIRIVQPTDRPRYKNDHMKKMQESILKSFKKQMPNTKVIVGFQDLRFSTITKKQEFVGKLDGQIQE